MYLRRKFSEAAWALAIWQLDSLFNTVRIACGAGSIKWSGVRPYVCPSVSLSHQSNAAATCGGFAAERRTCKRYRSTVPGARQQQRRSPGPQHGAQQQMTAELTRLNTDNVIIYKADDFRLHALPVTWHFHYGCAKRLRGRYSDTGTAKII